jgi:dihydrodipicolinate synthase/N-acetylneuraminate lyase
MKKFSGVIVASVTPFKQGKIYREGFFQLLDFYKSKGADAVFICGTTGEGMIMDVQARKEAATVALERSKIPVIIHSGTNNLEDTLALTKHAKDVGATAVAVITPMFYPYTDRGLAEYYLNVANSMDLPLFIYSNPSRAGVKMSPEAISEIFEKGPDNLVGVKESSADMTYLGKVIQAIPSKEIFNGADTCFLPGLVLGTSGQVSGYASLTPELYVQLYSAWMQQNIKEAMELQKKISKIKGVLEKPYIQPIKEGLKMRGIDVGDVKPPLVTMEKNEIEKLGNKLREFAPEIFQTKA